MFLSVLFFGVRRRPSAATTRREQEEAESQKVVFPVQLEFFLSTLGFAVGFGNVWRFPSLVYRFSGVFLIPYTVCLVCFGLPITYLHLILGQYSGQPTSHVFGMLSPIFSGVGWALLVVMIPLCTYYNSIVAWSLFYLSESIHTPVPWSPTLDCSTAPDNATVWWITAEKCRHWQQSPDKAILSAEYYLQDRVLSREEEFNLDCLFNIQPKMLVMMMGAWLLTFFGVSKGLKTMSKCVYVTATFPYIVLIVLLVLGCTLPGAWDLGIKYHMTPDFSRLTSEPEIWTEAAFMVFYSLGLDSGTLITLASFSRFHNNVHRDAILLVLLDTLTSILAGIVAFAFAGFLAHTSGTPPDIIKTDQLFLSFVVYPASFAYMDAPWLWSSLFFSMLLLAAIDCEFAWIEQVTAAMQRIWPATARHETRVTFVMCAVFFVLGLPLSSRAGVYVFRLFDDFTIQFNVIILNFLQVVFIGWIYGTDKVCKNIDEMSHEHTDSECDLSVENIGIIRRSFGPKGNYIMFSWKYLCPIVLVGLLIFGVITYKAETFDNVQFPKEVELFGWLMMMGPLICIPIAACYHINRTLRTSGCKTKELKKLFQPTDKWEQITCEDPSHHEAAKTLRYRRTLESTSGVEHWTSVSAAAKRRNASGGGSSSATISRTPAFTVEPSTASTTTHQRQNIVDAAHRANAGRLPSNDDGRGSLMCGTLYQGPTRLLHGVNSSVFGIEQSSTTALVTQAVFDRSSASLTTSGSKPATPSSLSRIDNKLKSDSLQMYPIGNDPNFMPVSSSSSFLHHRGSNVPGARHLITPSMRAIDGVINRPATAHPIFVVESSSSLRSGSKSKEDTATTASSSDSGRPIHKRNKPPLSKVPATALPSLKATPPAVDLLVAGKLSQQTDMNTNFGGPVSFIDAGLQNNGLHLGVKQLNVADSSAHGEFSPPPSLVGCGPGTGQPGFSSGKASAVTNGPLLKPFMKDVFVFPSSSSKIDYSQHSRHSSVEDVRPPSNEGHSTRKNTTAFTVEHSSDQKY